MWKKILTIRWIEEVKKNLERNNIREEKIVDREF